MVTNHEEHLSQKGKKKNRKEIKNCFTLGKISLTGPWLYPHSAKQIFFALSLKVHKHKSISTGAQYVTLDNKIKCLSLADFSGNPTDKTVTGTAYTWDY
jgi:hypothetical protein